MCTTAGCNDPSTDTCTRGDYSSLGCGGKKIAYPTAATSDIKCFEGSNSSVALQSTATSGNTLCVAFSTNCGMQNRGPFCPRDRPNFNGTLRVRASMVSIAAVLSTMSGSTVPATSAGFQSAMTGFFGTDITTLFLGPGNPIRKSVNDLLICSTEGCNGGSADTCAPADKPVKADLKFNSLPSSSFSTDSTGKKSLNNDAVTVLTQSIETAVQANACATCTVTLTKVVEDATGSTVYEAPTTTTARRLLEVAPGGRRLQSGDMTVTFSTLGGTATQLAAVSTAAASSSFTQAVTSTIASVPGYSSVTAASAYISSNPKTAAAMGLLGLLALVVVPVALYWFCCKKKKPTAVGPIGGYQANEKGVLVVNAPPGATVVIQQQSV